MESTTTTDLTTLSSFEIDRLPGDTVVVTDPTTHQLLTLTEVRALEDNEWGAWRDLDRHAYTVAYGVHVRGDWDAVVRARRDRQIAIRRAVTEALIAERIAAEAARPTPEVVTPDWSLVGPTVEVTLPHRFYDDHVSRGLNPGSLVRVMRSGVRVLLDATAFDDLLGDADYYSDPSDFDRDYIGLCSSARATATRLRRAGRPA